LRNACGAPGVCVECAVQARAQRIQRWRAVGTPEVGIFYVIDGELWHESTPLPEARQLPEVRLHVRKHRSYWKMFRQASPALHGLPHTCYPRGRVVYVHAPARYHLADADMVRQVMAAMQLPTGQTEVRLAPHFRTRSLL
jgi:hypothetical protein